MEAQREVARKAHFFLDVDYGRFGQDSVVMCGDGVDDLDRAIETVNLIASRPKSKRLIDLGSHYSAYHPGDVEDLMAIRSFYVGFYGEVNKPDAYRPARTKAIPL